MGTLILIPARFGSKGVFRKNIRSLLGKPLITYSIEFANIIKEPDDLICISTNDKEVITISQNYKNIVLLVRPEELSTDTSGMNEVLIHAINYFENQGIIFDKLLILQPTSPYRDKLDYLLMKKLYDFKTDMVVSVKESKSNPYFNLFEEDNNGYLNKSKNGNFVRRQDCPKIYEYNGSMYLIKINSLKLYGLQGLKNIKKHVMSLEKSIDIDTEIDWIIAENLLK